MQVPFNDLKLLHSGLKDEILTSIGNIIDNSTFILGTGVRNFENDFADSIGVKHCTGVSSGTDANHLALWANGIGPGDEVIIPANTFIATAWGVTLCGATPVFADCEKDSYNLDPADVKRKITQKTKAVVPVHLYGQTADMDTLKSVCSGKNILIVEDAAQAHFAEYKGRMAGSLSVAASFSFYPGKNLGAIGEAGALTTDNDSLDSKFRMLRDHGSEKKYYHNEFGHNYRMDGIQGAALGIKLKHLKLWTDLRRLAAKFYDDQLSGIDGITLPKEMPYAKHVYHLYVVKCHRREELIQFLGENGISTGLHYPVPLHLQECFTYLGYKTGDFPQTEDLAGNCVSLPIYPGITEEQLGYVCEKIKHFFKSL
jgi:dTDP-4-amino-4,6-dideoxygalactose transaminase